MSLELLAGEQRRHRRRSSAVAHSKTQFRADPNRRAGPASEADAYANGRPDSVRIVLAGQRDVPHGKSCKWRCDVARVGAMLTTSFARQGGTMSTHSHAPRARGAGADSTYGSCQRGGHADRAVLRPLRRKRRPDGTEPSGAGRAYRAIVGLPPRPTSCTPRRSRASRPGGRGSSRSSSRRSPA